MNFEWLAGEAKTIHAVFANSFYIFVGALILIGVLLEFFKLPLGGSPEVGKLVSRAVLACLMLVALPEIMNVLSDVTDALSKQIGDLNNFKLVTHKMGEKLHELKFSWVSVKEGVILLISFLTFFILYFTVYLADALYLYTWTLLFIFSPILIALFVLPSTAGATKALFRSLIEVCAWKVMWSTLSVLLWSFALSEINKPEFKINFFTVVLLNLMLAFSIVITPIITRALAGKGISNVAGSMGATMVGAAGLTAGQMISTSKKLVSRGVRGGKRLLSKGSDSKVDESEFDSEKATPRAIK